MLCADCEGLKPSAESAAAVAWAALLWVLHFTASAFEIEFIEITVLLPISVVAI